MVYGFITGPLLTGPLVTRLVSLSLVLVMVRCCIVCISAVFSPFALEICWQSVSIMDVGVGVRSVVGVGVRSAYTTSTLTRVHCAFYLMDSSKILICKIS